MSLNPSVVGDEHDALTFHPAPDAWRQHDGSVNSCPAGGASVAVRFRDGSTYGPCKASTVGTWAWGSFRYQQPTDIVAWRFVKPEATAPTEPGLAINPKDAIGSSKMPLHLWPAEATALGCIGMLEGMLKYGRNNYIAGEGVIASIYVDALFRHVSAWFEGENLTDDTKADHLGNALACLAIIVKARAHGKLIDDRNYGTLPDGARYRAFIEELTPHVARLKAMFADKAPRHFTIADVQGGAK